MKKSGVILLTIVLLAFVYGLTQMFKIRFESGDIYPAYSSFRTDPLGTKALYDSLHELVGAERNFKPMPKLESSRNTALLVLGIMPEQLRVSPTELREIEQYVMSGGRLVLSFFPVFTAEEIKPRRKQAAGGQPSNQPTSKEKEEDDRGVLLNARWDFGLDHAALKQDDARTYQPDLAANKSSDSLPPFISTHSALCFDKLNSAWRVIYSRPKECAVLIERKLGSGSIVIAADSYVFSNEALLKERQPKLLAWFTGGASTVIFDETHLGVQEHRGIAALARKYRLHGFAAGLLVLAGLFVWRYSFSLVPLYEKHVDREQSDLIAGKEAAAGFTNLLRRNISAKELLKICLEEWNKSCRHRVARPRLEKVQAAIDQYNGLPERVRDPVAVYRQISQALSRSRT